MAGAERKSEFCPVDNVVDLGCQRCDRPPWFGRSRTFLHSAAGSPRRYLRRVVTDGMCGCETRLRATLRVWPSLPDQGRPSLLGKRRMPGEATDRRHRVSPAVTHNVTVWKCVALVTGCKKWGEVAAMDDGSLMCCYAPKTPTRGFVTQRDPQATRIRLHSVTTAGLICPGCARGAPFH